VTENSTSWPQVLAALEDLLGALLADLVQVELAELGLQLRLALEQDQQGKQDV
jgi:hypothetical protein